jgi:PEGA domain
VYLCLPKWTEDWVKKNDKKFPGIHFSQTPVPGTDNYLIVFSTSTDVLSGFQPVVRWNTTTSVSDVSGRGAAADIYGSTWTYTYQGTATTTTMTTTQEDVPYTVETTTIYASAYGGPSNSLVAQNSESTVRQEGGDSTAAVVTNLGGLMRRIRIKTRLLDGAVRDIAKLPSPTAQAEPTSKAQGINPSGNATVHFTSSPNGGEIYVDGKFVGNTPSDITIAAGEHLVKVTSGGNEWSRPIQITSGEISLHAEVGAPATGDRTGQAGTGQEIAPKDNAVSQMRRIVAAIRQCPEVTWPGLIDNVAVWHQHSPSILEWDVLASTSLRARFQGYVLFEVSSYPEETDEAKRSKKLDRDFLVLMSVFPSSMKYRYEFDLGSDAPELNRALRAESKIGDTSVATPNFSSYDPNGEGYIRDCWNKIAYGTSCNPSQRGAVFGVWATRKSATEFLYGLRWSFYVCSSSFLRRVVCPEFAFSW